MYPSLNNSQFKNALLISNCCRF